MSESDEKPFTVNDRRKFTPEGQVRDEAGETATAGAGPLPPVPAGPPETASEAPATGERERAGAGGARGPAGAPGPVDFSQFLLSLGAQAGALLSGAGGEGGPEEEAEALAHAQSIISILEMLEDKTRGRRTADEDRLLEGLLFELRMAYVQKRRAGAP